MLKRTVSKKTLQVSAMVFVTLASCFAKASQPGIMICHDQNPTDGNQYLVLKQSYFLTFDSRLEEENEQGFATELDVSTLPSIDSMQHTGGELTHCKEVNAASLIADHPDLEKIILNFQASAGGFQQDQEYKIIPLPAPFTSADLRSKVEVSLIASAIVFSLFAWSIPDYALYSAAGAGIACYFKPDCCTSLYTASVGVIFSLIDQSWRVAFRWMGGGSEVSGDSDQKALQDKGNLRKARLSKLSVNK